MIQYHTKLLQYSDIMHIAYALIILLIYNVFLRSWKMISLFLLMFTIIYSLKYHHICPYLWYTMAPYLLHSKLIVWVNLWSSSHTYTYQSPFQLHARATFSQNNNSPWQTVCNWWFETCSFLIYVFFMNMKVLLFLLKYSKPLSHKKTKQEFINLDAIN